MINYFYVIALMKFVVFSMKYSALCFRPPNVNQDQNNLQNE